MARIDDIVDVLEQASLFKKVFNDGNIYDKQKDQRHLLNVPYIELAESDIDMSEHTSTTRMRKATCRGVITLLRERDNVNDVEQVMENLFNNRPQLHLIMDERLEFLNRLWRIPFTVDYFETRNFTEGSFLFENFDAILLEDGGGLIQE